VVLFATSFFWTAFDLLDFDGNLIALLVGGSLLLAAIGIDRSGHGDITPAMYFFGAIGFLYGFFDSVKRTALENYVSSSRRRIRVPGDGPPNAHAALCRHVGDSVVHGLLHG
jgi:hypothetical protein